MSSLVSAASRCLCFVAGSRTTSDPIVPQFHPVVASTLPIGDDDVLMQYTAAVPPTPPLCCSLIAPPIQGALEALMILSSTSGEDLRAAIQLCPTTTVLSRQGMTRHLQFKYATTSSPTAPERPSPSGMPVDTHARPTVESRPPTPARSDTSEDSSSSSSMISGQEILTVVAELITAAEALEAVAPNSDETGPTGADPPVFNRAMISMIRIVMHLSTVIIIMISDS